MMAPSGLTVVSKFTHEYQQNMAEISLSGPDLAQAVVILKSGGVVAFPTETYYGLAVDPFAAGALERLFALKRRDSKKPVLLLIEHAGQIPLLARDVPAEFATLMEKFWPGPLTLLFTAVGGLSPLLTGDTGTVGMRISSHPTAQGLVSLCGQPITATSANFSGLPAAVSAAELKHQFGDLVDFVLDGGKTPGGKGSTVLGLSNGKVKIIRPGVVSSANINKALKKN